MSHVKIGETLVGPGRPCYVIAEIGINHNGSVDLAKRLIDSAVEAGCNAVKFQKRTVEVVYSAEELAQPLASPFGTTNGDLKRGREFGFIEYGIIQRYCRDRNIDWFASCWDEGSVDFVDQFDPVCYKIASASLTDDDLLRHTRSMGRPIILSTGMSTQNEVDHAIRVLGKDDLVLMHTCSTYPSKPTELNLRTVPALASRYNIPVGYSGHELGIATTVAAVALGACALERHITLDKTMWGTDQAISVEPHDLATLVRDVRQVEVALGDGAKRMLPSELAAYKRLRRVTGMSKIAA